MAQVWQAVIQVLWSMLFVLAAEFVILGYFLRGLPFFRRLGRDLLFLSLASAIPVWLGAWNPSSAMPAFWELFWQTLFSFCFCAFLVSSAFTAAETYDAPRTKWAIPACAALWPISLMLSLWEERLGLPGAYLPWEIALGGAALFTVLSLSAHRTRRTGVGISSYSRFLARAYWLPALSSIGALLMEPFRPGWSPQIWLVGYITYGALGVYLFADHLIGLYTEQEDLLLKTAEANQSMEREKPLQELGRNTAEVSREIRGFTGQLKHLVQGLFSEQETGRDAGLERIERARQSLERYTQGILDYAASFNVKLEDDVELVSWIRAELEKLCGDLGLDLNVKTQSGQIPLRVDAAFLRKALFQLCRNAKEAGARRLVAEIMRVESKASLVLDDDGQGCPREFLDRIRDPFFTTKKNTGACGLGLAIADEILRGHGGELSIGLGLEREGGGEGFVVIAEWPLEAASERE